MRATTSLRVIAVVGACLVSGVTWAQSTSAPASPPASDVSRQGGSLSEKLNNSNGVIHP